MGYNFSQEAKLTNEQLAGELAKLSPLTVDEINKLLPAKVDKERFKQLIDIVNNSTAQQKKIASLYDNFSEVGGVAMKLLVKYLKPL